MIKILQQKIDAGVHAPTYPQYKDMNQQILSVINNPECAEESFKVREDCAQILELQRQWLQSTGKSTDLFQRAGVERNDIFNPTAILNEKYNTNVWKEPERLKEVVTYMETPDIVTKRPEKAYSMFGELIRYAGPDCGLGAWPDQEIATQLHNNVVRRIMGFEK